MSPVLKAVPALSSEFAAEMETLLVGLLGGPLPVGLRAWDGSTAGPQDGPAITIESPQALRRLLWHPNELGLAQAYVTGEIDIDGDLGAGLRHIWQAVRSGTVSGPPAPLALVTAAPLAVRLGRRMGALSTPVRPPATQARLRGRLHSQKRDSAAIAHHYDLSNEFYALVLDKRLVYSCGYWSSDQSGYTLDDAQTDKLDLVCSKLELGAGDRLLDVGCGWGATAIHAAQHYGATVTGITLSQEQAKFARGRVDSLGLGDRVEIRVQDYRELSGDEFDAVSSLEMGEHVGATNYPVYTETLHRVVRPGGRVLVQQMSRGATAPGGGAFIEAFIAPDMNMRPVGDTVNLIEQGGLEVIGVQAMREHYVRTIDAWADLFEASLDQAVALVGEEMARVWRLYLVGSSLSFEEGRMGVDQILAIRPNYSGF